LDAVGNGDGEPAAQANGAAGGANTASAFMSLLGKLGSLVGKK
jgi:hypothetical protein